MLLISSLSNIFNKLSNGNYTYIYFTDLSFNFWKLDDVFNKFEIFTNYFYDLTVIFEMFAL